jgi:TolB-like protein
MGEVYRAHDGRLGRDVAIKVLSADVSSDSERRQRFDREARAIAALNHPHICAVHDIGQENNLAYLVMELLDGESLASRLERGPLPPEEALQSGITAVETLGVVHRHGLIHRDLKPANIFLSEHGLKLLDFGLARSLTPSPDTALTHDGFILGTPRYLAPEQIRGGDVDHRTDIFAVAVVIYEMLAGRPPFDRDEPIELVHAIVYEEPAPLPPGTVSSPVEHVLRRALAKDPADRPQSAAEFASALQAAISEGDTAPSAPAAPRRRGPTRAMVLPFRLLRADPDIDFLGFSLADAVAASLAGLDSIVVRSNLAAQAGPATDLRLLAQQAAVDVVLTGTLLRVGSQVRVSAQLLEVPEGSLLWSHTVQAPIEDLFQLQDALTNAIVSSLHVPLTDRDHRVLRLDVPANPAAYELYLRANQLVIDPANWSEARSLYDQAVTLDPGYAPAWARLGRVLGLMAKYSGLHAEADSSLAERAFQRALALNPELATAHHFYAYVEAEVGRAPEAMGRLLRRARLRRSDSELYAGLVTTCRYSGLLDWSVAAHELALRFDPRARTSVACTWYLRGDYARTIEWDSRTQSYMAPLARFRLGEHAVALSGMSNLADSTPHAIARLVANAYHACMAGHLDSARKHFEAIRASTFRDPEGFFLGANVAALAGAHADALALLETAVDRGFTCPANLREDDAWDSVRAHPAFERLLQQSDASLLRAADLFGAAGGAALLSAIPSTTGPVSPDNAGLFHSTGTRGIDPGAVDPGAV